MSNVVLNVCPNCGSQVKPNDFFCNTCGVKLTAKSSVESIKGYIQVIGAVEIVFGIMALVGGLLVAILAAFVPRIMMMENFPGSFDSDFPDFVRADYLPVFVAVLLGLVALLLLVYAIVSIASGAKLLQYKNSGRIGTLIIGAINLFNVPLGTVFGLAALYVLSRPEAEQLFNSSPRNDNTQRYYYSVSH